MPTASLTATAGPIIASHLGAEMDGINIYGRTVTDAIPHVTPYTVRHVAGPTLLTRDNRAAVLADIKRNAEGAVGLVMQFNERLWGGQRQALANLHFIVRRVAMPVVVTFHDVYSKGRWRYHLLTRFWSTRLRLAGARVVVHSPTERDILARDGFQPAVIPHFVRAPTSSVERATGHREQRRKLVVSGFISQRKGHLDAIRVLPLLPPDYVLRFAGTVNGNDQKMLDAVWKLADKLGVRQRLTITGALPDAAYERELESADLALCPFLRVSTSGSLSQWLGVKVPIVASALPQNLEACGDRPNVHFYPPGDVPAMARAIVKAASNRDVDGAGVDRFLRTLSVPAIARQYAALFDDLANGRNAIRSGAASF
jgi:glycosyltransferase involved in cell wall biosynthesis